MLKPYYQRGIGLLELMLSLTVTALLLVMASRYYTTVRTNYRVHEGLGMVHAVYSAAESWLQNNATLPAGENVARKSFIDNGNLPSTFAVATVNPWGGDISITGVGQTVIIKMLNVPQADCINMTEKLQQKLSAAVVQAIDCTKNPITFTLNLATS
jgi:Tfp pilus assembly protein PilE